jgi:hypothetical protein
MSKPLGYYTNYTSGDSGLLGDMEESWGSTFSKLNNIDRLWMISKIADNLCADICQEQEIEDLSEHVEEVVERVDTELSRLDKLGLMEALLAQAKSA